MPSGLLLAGLLADRLAGWLAGRWLTDTHRLGRGVGKLDAVVDLGSHLGLQGLDVSLAGQPVLDHVGRQLGDGVTCLRRRRGRWGRRGGTPAAAL